MTDKNDNTNPAYMLTVDYIIRATSLPLGSIWIERIGTDIRVVHADFSSTESALAENIYQSLMRLIGHFHGRWFVVLDHEDWRKGVLYNDR